MPRNVDPGSIKKGSGLANQNSVDSNSFTDEVIEGQQHGLEAHINDPQDAHDASAISTTTSGGIYYGDDVQSNLDELSALVPPRPPSIGNFSTFLEYTGIPDWGRLKLNDGGFVARGQVVPPDPGAPTNDFFVFNEFWWPPFEAQNIFPASPNPPGGVFTTPGQDPSTDPTFNVLEGAATHQGGFTRTIPVIETARVRESGDFETNVSGTVYPADRGVIALFHWPAGGDVSDFLAQPLTDQVVAAILCGQGINGDCDGDPGGIFEEGDPNVFAFPGRATGQYDLVELHSGTNNQTGDPLPGGANSAAGQVRLGSDPAAGVPVVVGGIPILGATSIANGGGNNTNFFRYRLPYLDDYSAATGIEYTPAVERPRYFEKPPVSLDPGVDLTQAGDFPDFPKDYWTFQVCRFRHEFDVGLDFPDHGSYLLLHFRREADFEAFARDGIMPDDVSFGYDLWSAGLVNYSFPESTDNLIDVTDPLAPVTSAAYHVLRGAIFTPDNPGLINTALSFTYDRERDEVMFCSGVQHFLPNGSGIGTNWQIDTLSFGVDNLFNSSYRLGFNAGATAITPGLTHMNPAVLYLGAGTADQNIVNGLGVGYTGTAFYQRVDFDYTDLDSVSGPFDLTTGPTTLASADIILLGGDTPITFAGDDAQCHFWFNARVRMFVRRPPLHNDATPGMTEFTFPLPGGDMVLMHTTSHSPSFDSGGDYGNFKTGVGDFPPRANLENPRKDVEERFYDEVYRVAQSSMIMLDPTYNGSVGNLTGPGLPFGPLGPLELPVRFASEALVSFGFASYLRTDLHQADLALSPLVAALEAQVSGLPDRSPPATDGVENPCPFSGMLIYPQIDYTTGFRPSIAGGDTTVTQPNYSTIADADRRYIRVFDAAYSNQAAAGDREPGVVGQPFLTFRIDGLELADFAYAAPGPGSALIALEVKVPGLTTWMDLGRRDMDGPSKQDPLVDGAGCQILDPNATFDGRDAVTGTVFCQVRINMGPAINVFANTGLNPLAPLGVAPVMVRARIKAAGAAYNFTQGGPDASSDTPRALTGVTLLRHSDGLGPNDAAPFGPPAFP
jgi:hypothetical protein